MCLFNSRLHAVCIGRQVPWPECQEFMEYQLFYDEAILAVGAEDKVGTSAYFIPERRVVSEKYQQTKIS